MDTNAKTNKGDREAEDEDSDDFQCNKEENNNIGDKWDARFYNYNGEYGVVDDKEPQPYSNHSTTSTSFDSTSVSQNNS